MQRRAGDRLYGLLILTILMLVALSVTFVNRQRREAQEAVVKQSLYGQPWEAFGVWCASELNLQQPHIPFTVEIEHPPGDREILDETIRKLVRTGATPQPWPENALDRYLILRTRCKASWAEVYELKRSERRKIEARLHNPQQPDEADYRQAILREEFEYSGTADAALEWFPLTAATPEAGK